MLTIGFVVPSGSYNYEPLRNQPLVTLYLLTILENYFGEKIRLSLIDLRGHNAVEQYALIPENDVFMYSVATPDYYEISDVVTRLRVRYPKAKHIAGGPHINIFPQESAKFFDAIALGESEESIITIVQDVLRSKLKRVYRQKKSVDIDNYPYPLRKFTARDTVTTKGLLGGKYLSLRGTAVIFSRGCPFSCHFCPNKELTFGPVRYRSPALVTEEIEYLKREYQVEALALKDDNSIPLNKKIAGPFLDAIGRTTIKWRGQSRANGIDADTVKRAADSGCIDIGIGIESVSAYVLKLVNKRIDLAQAKQYIALLRKHAIGVRLHFIIGLPGEPEDVVEKTLEFIDETQPHSVLLSLFCPMPGSEIYRHPKRFGIKLLTADWRKYHTAFARFSGEERPTIVFKYNKKAPWGNGMGNERIVDNYLRLQSILRERKLNF